jgi:hypothetical protein
VVAKQIEVSQSRQSITNICKLLSGQKTINAISGLFLVGMGSAATEMMSKRYTGNYVVSLMNGSKIRSETHWPCHWVLPGRPTLEICAANRCGTT